MDKLALLEFCANRAPSADRDHALVEACRERTVLDVGCVGQARTRSSGDWLHDKLVRVSTEVVGVDTNVAGVEALRREGYQVTTPDALDQARRFQRVVMGDVIEHVDAPVSFLRTYASYLEPDGHLLVTTPNAFSAAQVVGIALSSRAAVNAEHTCWFDPMTFAEVAERAGLRIVDFSWLRTPLAPLGWKSRLVVTLSGLATRVRPFLADSFLVTLARRESAE